MQLRPTFFVIAVTVVAALVATAQTRQKADPPAKRTSKIDVSVIRVADGKYRIEAFEVPPDPLPGMPVPNNPWEGVTRARDFHWFPPPGTKVDGQPDPGAGPAGWNGKVKKGGAGSSVNFYAGPGGDSLSSDPFNPSVFEFTPGAGASESPYSSLVVTSDGGGEPPRTPWHRRNNVIKVIQGDDAHPLPGPIIWIETPWRSIVVPQGGTESTDMSFPYPGLPYGGSLYAPTAGTAWNGTLPYTLSELLEIAEPAPSDRHSIQPMTEAISPQGTGVVYVSTGTLVPGRYVLALWVDDEADGDAPSEIDSITFVDLEVVSGGR